ncbi:hypothetical protein F6S25_32155, partial [Klebsiella pneumoniae]|uniref:hypothetical protein n=1 Tax=Klebsiella pneumoniae TaxID=573 RepID=UPI0028E0D1D8
MRDLIVRTGDGRPRRRHRQVRRCWPTDNRTGLFDKVRGWMGAADKGSGGERPLQVAVIGSGGAAMA